MQQRQPPTRDVPAHYPRRAPRPLCAWSSQPDASNAELGLADRDDPRTAHSQSPPPLSDGSFKPGSAATSVADSVAKTPRYR
jgi:hypothetical protein